MFSREKTVVREISFKQGGDLQKVGLVSGKNGGLKSREQFSSQLVARRQEISDLEARYRALFVFKLETVSRGWLRY